jgi:hypothetical protein
VLVFALEPVEGLDIPTVTVIGDVYQISILESDDGWERQPRDQLLFLWGVEVKKLLRLGFTC